MIESMSESTADLVVAEQGAPTRSDTWMLRSAAFACGFVFVDVKCQTPPGRQVQDMMQRTAPAPLLLHEHWRAAG